MDPQELTAHAALLAYAAHYAAYTEALDNMDTTKMDRYVYGRQCALRAVDGIVLSLCAMRGQSYPVDTLIATWDARRADYTGEFTKEGLK